MNKWLSKANKRISLGGAASMLIAVTLVGQIIGFVRNRLVSTNFTVVDPGSSDAFFAAFQIPDFFFYTIAAGALGVAFIPFLSDQLERGDKKAMWELTASLFNLLALTMFVVGIILFVFAENLIGIVAPKLSPEHFDNAVMIMRLIAMNPLLFTLSGILTSVQQTFGRFFFYAVSPLFYNLAIIVSIYLFKDSLGIVGLGVGALAGAVLQLGIAALGLIGLGFKWKPIIKWKSKEFKQVMRQLPARSVDQGIDSINSIVETNRAVQLGAGPVSYYNYALTLHNVPILLIGASIATAAFPRLTERLSQNRSDLFRKDFLTVLRAVIWITLPVVVVSWFGRAYLARLLFGQASPPVATIFGFLTVAIFFRIVYAIISRYFYAHKDNTTPLVVSIFAIALNIFLAFQLAKPEAYGAPGLAMAQSFVAFFEVMILGSIMLKRDNKLLDGRFWGGVARSLSVTGFSLVTAYAMVTAFPLGIRDTGIITLGTKFGLIAGTTLLVHVFVSLLFGLREAVIVVDKAKEMILKPIRL